MYSIHWKREIPAFIIMLLMVISGIYLYPKLPAQIPMHWNLTGAVDNYAVKSIFSVLMVPMLSIFIYILLIFIPFFDPKKDQYIKFAKTYFIVRYTLVLFFAFIFSIIMAATMGIDIPMHKIIPCIVGLLFIILGNYMGKLRQNWFIGLRFPWTMASENVWNKTNRLGGKLFVFAGIVSMFGALLASPWPFILLLGSIGIATIVPIIYSLILYKTETRNKD